jgi:archaemetzincin
LFSLKGSDLLKRRALLITAIAFSIILIGSISVVLWALKDNPMFWPWLCPWQRFCPPDSEQRNQAIGNIGNLPQPLRACFSDSNFFQSIPQPSYDIWSSYYKDADWLSVVKEKGQTFSQFVDSKPARLNIEHSVIYIQPLGNFSGESSPPIERLVQFTEAFFQMPVKILPPMDMSGCGPTRINSLTHKRQFLCGDIETFLFHHCPKDAYVDIGITMEDIYSIYNGQAWDYLFGEASCQQPVAVFSFARFDPAFFGISRPKNFKELILKRSCAVLSHEISHSFGIAHCIYFHCLMNGSNSLEETDRTPLHLCPVDLRKLQYSIHFDVIKRYTMLKQFYDSVGINDEARWLDSRLSYLKSFNTQKLQPVDHAQ